MINFKNNIFKKKQHPYEVFAEVYDYFMNYVDYIEWAFYIDLLLKKYGNNIKNVVDCACGTAKLSAVLKSMSYRVAGFDLSKQMLRNATKKDINLLWQGNMTAIALHREWDASLCLYDSLQYLSKKDLEIFFQEVYSIIIPKGLFIVDLVPECHLITYWSDFTDKDLIGKWEIVRKSKLNRRARQQNTYFSFKNRETGEVFTERHVQYVYSIEEIVLLLKKSGMKLLGVFNEFSQKKGSEHSDRVHILCRVED